MDKKLSISLENSLVPLKTVSLVSGQILSKVRTPKESLRDPTGQAAKKPVNPEKASFLRGR
jgi:hypothetical protein